MMRENDQTQRVKNQGELIPERQISLSLSSNIPLMSMNPISTSNSSSTSTLFEKTSSLDLTASLMNNINSLASRPQTTVNKTSTPYLNSGSIGLFPSPSNLSMDKNTKSAAAELDDLFN